MSWDNPSVTIKWTYRCGHCYITSEKIQDYNFGTMRGLISPIYLHEYLPMDWAVGNGGFVCGECLRFPSERFHINKSKDDFK